MPNAARLFITGLTLLTWAAPAHSGEPKERTLMRHIGAAGDPDDGALSGALDDAFATSTFRGAPYAPTAAWLVEGTDGVQRLYLSGTNSDATCRGLMPRGEGLPYDLSLSPCGAVCPQGASFSTAPSDAVVMYGASDARRPKDAKATVAMARVDRDKRVASGALTYEASDGSSLDLPFTATLCSSVVRPRAKAAPIHGLAWGRSAVPPETLPTARLSGVAAGRPFDRAAARLYPSAAPDHYELVFYGVEPAKPCPGADAIGWQLDAPTVLRVRLPASTLKPGGAMTSRSYLIGPRDGATQVALTWPEPELNVVASLSEDRNLSLAIDAVDRAEREVRGRLYLAFEDRGRSFFVGGFEALYCPGPNP